MSGMSLSDLSEKMRDIDIAMLATHTDGGAIAARPMSNNREVDYDGDSCYFTWDESRMIDDIKRDPKVSLTFQGSNMFSVAVEGKAEVIHDKKQFEEHWTPDLDEWFADGIDTKGLAMIKVHAERIHYWNGEDNGELTVN
ncbi:pyridoxamine 5'-phosphate oxidase family protein [Rhizobium sp. XQZ8]|uniref:pyridoxamine 5'-phosphate oxidase family protein n=1 Tax=Rhizobium populisoli TaxID=2859785 RepID=UPI001CA4E404|nr:pyridoxamine 5'-phosphate oxidase family protein [Rhizobium populisoli]MBW6422414.1 pyridoxamine 5'-phosphate oxidase family protein [Rhizobium populisoli]